jgi:DNA-directed RNA polymerase alpha subunit
MTENEVTVMLAEAIDQDKEYKSWHVSTKHLMTFAKLVAAKEREAIAQMVEPWLLPEYVEKIRARQLVIDEMRGEGDDTLMFIDELEFSARTSNCLKGAGIQTVGQLKQWTRNDLLKLPNLGKKSIKEIDEVTKENGIELRDLKHD